MNDVTEADSLAGLQARTYAPLTNMALALRTVMSCQEAAYNGLPHMGLLYGPSGYGKTWSASFVAAETGALYVQAKSVWTGKTLLKAIAEEAGVGRVSGNAAVVLDQIKDVLGRDPRPVIIDEADFMVTKNYVDVIRDIYETAQACPIILIGEEALPAKLKAWERFDNRILVATPAQAASENDARILRDHYCRGIEIADDLVEFFRVGCKGITRRIVTNLRAAQDTAAEEGVGAIDRAWWGDRAVRNGDVPVRRREFA